MPNTTWNPADKTSTMALSGSNLIATSAAFGDWVRSVDKLTSGKCYWEATMTHWSGGSTGVGLTNPTSTPNSWNSTGLVALFTDGNVYFSGVSVANTLTGATVGATIGFALDAGARLAWFRVTPSGNWNGNLNGNPATGAGGVSLAAISGAGFLAVVESSSVPDAATANFGNTAFNGAVPAGFTSGFPAGGGGAAAAQARALVLA